ncbi:EF-hand [Microstroma glucosiphilum]|uniref:EF-hand n=1 Tax=Pseudomicrostroma glucosiphilum TaxID=1684307 RepID=A0A316UFL6_9BASI|nr:EF-hand [Pseudomicrostroma glucosiphilum]PWN23728.1 EF-hand [Pseudomicrostroma glucosiphilum]
MSQQYSYGPGSGGYGSTGGGGGGGGGGGYGSGGYGSGGYGGPPAGGPPPPPQHPYQQGGYGAGGYGASQGQGGYGARPPPPPQQQQGGGYGAGGYGAGGYGGGGGGPGGPPGGGYGQPQRPQAFNDATGPPPGADLQLWQWFIAVDGDRSGRISPVELQSALVNADNTTFDLDTVKMLMTIFDTDRSGEVTFNEFVGLFEYVQTWRGIFQKFDSDRSGSIDQNELGNALQSFGFGLSPRLLTIVTQKYITPPSSSRQPPGGARVGSGVTFDRFVRCCCVVKALTEGFQKHDPVSESNEVAAPSRGVLE